MGEILIFADINPVIPNFVCYSGPIAVYGARLKVLLPEEVKKKISNLA